jgi:tetratricopeptide (TPR) repeat protein
MQIDPTRWLVSFAGFVVDWLLSREWKRILVSSIPVLLLCTVVGLVWWGRNLDRGKLAAWYMQLGNEEIAEWEQAWAPPAESELVLDAEEMTGPEEPSESGETDEGQAEIDEDPNQLSRFAEILFRRVQLLSPSDRSQFVIGATLAQRGAVEQAKSMLTRIAPNTDRGYLPAHSLLAQIYLLDLKQQPSQQLLEMLRHHVSQAIRWERVPQGIMQVAYDLARQEGDADKSVSLLAQAAERNPQENFALAEFCHSYNLGRKERKLELNRNYLRIFKQAWEESEALFRDQVAADPRDATARVQLASLYVMADQAERNLDLQVVAGEEEESDQHENEEQEAESLMDRAERILREGEAIESSPEILRGLSELYRFRFVSSTQESSPGQFSADLQLLDAALRIDPTNPRIDETVARLVKLGGPTTPEQIERLKASLAQGKATAITHRLIAEKYLIDVNYEEAVPHLEQVIQRLPSDTNSLNNLAFVLAATDPERLDEAFKYSMQAVSLAAAAKRPNADYFDTLGDVLSKLQRGKEAITAYETAIELNPQRIDFHEKVAAEYLKLGDASMAEMHARQIQRLESQQQNDQANSAAEVEASAVNPEPIVTPPDPTGVVEEAETDNQPDDRQ